ncbi:hypothetical protein [Parapedobacter sp. 10938]|uniref:hypothetical protein n=1 Tax=Parapedobacter flavus TaxID=3110225 RepID=UPI002DBCDF40|nr:hypothetical protein [Parapedobacter sp. 10938]MEC3880207.1 hypothetical protein [Parapedobacter sp. 10938]
MESYYVTNNLLIGSLALAVGNGLWRYRKLDTGMKFFWMLICTTMISEVLAYILAIRYGNNLGVYAVSSIVSIFFTCMYFNYSIPLFHKYKVGYIIAAISTAIGIISNFFLQSVNQFPSYFLHYQALIVIAMAMFSLAQMLYSYDYFDVKVEPHFWACVILIFFWSITYFNWTLFQYYKLRLEQHNRFILLSMFMVNLITNIGTALLLFLTPKMQKDVR